MEPVEQQNISALHSIIRRFREEDRYHDVSIQVDAEIFRCHRLLLVALSEFFDRMFTEGHFRESNIGKDDPVVLREVDPAAFGEVLNFMYSGSVRVSDSNYYDLIRTSDFLQLRIPYVKEQCINHLQRTMVPKLEPIPNAVEIFEFARRSSAEKVLLDILGKHIFRHLNHFSKEPEFLNLSLDNLNLVLSYKSSFSHVNEDLLVETIMRWVDYDRDKRKKCPDELMSNVDLSKLSQHYVNFLMRGYAKLMHHSCEKAMQFHDEFINCFDVSKLSPKQVSFLVDQYANYRSHTSLTDLTQSSQSDTRITYYNACPCDDVTGPNVSDDVTLHVLTYYSGERRGSSIFSLNETSAPEYEWSHLWGHEFPVTFDNFTAYSCKMRVIELGNTIYHMSYDYDKERFINFGIQDSICAPIKKYLTIPPSLLYFRNYYRLQICGEQSQNNIYLYNQKAKLLQYICELDKWFSIPVDPLCNNGDTNAVCLIVDHLLYLIGMAVERGKLNCNLAYDLRTNEWHQLPTELTPWSWHSSDNIQRFISDTCTHQGKLFAACNGQQSNNAWDIFMYDPRTQRWIENSELHGTKERKNNSIIIESPLLVPYRNELWMLSTYGDLNIEKYDITSGSRNSLTSLNAAVKKVYPPGNSRLLDTIVSSIL